VRDL
jgi:hypothetical protein